MLSLDKKLRLKITHAKKDDNNGQKRDNEGDKNKEWRETRSNLLWLTNFSLMLNFY